MRNASLQDVFTALQQQSHLRFLYSNEDVDNIKVEQLKSEQEKIGTILDQVLKNTGLTWKIQDHIIFIKKAKITVPPVESVKITGKVTDQTGNPLPGVTVCNQRYFFRWSYLCGRELFYRNPLRKGNRTRLFFCGDENPGNSLSR